MLWHSLFIDSTSWTRVLEPLAAQRRLVLIDGPGHGRSASATRDLSLDACADAACEVLDALGIEGALDWVGNAWGGHVGILFAARRPERCRSLITIGTPVPALPPSVRRQVRPMVAVYRWTGPVKPLTTVVVTALLGRDAAQRDPEAVRAIASAFRGAPRRRMSRALRAMMLQRPDLSDRLAEIAAPALMVTAADDDEVTPAACQAAAASLRHGTCVVVPGHGRVSPLFMSAPALAGVITRFWSDPTAAAAAAGATPLVTGASGGRSHR